MLYQLVLNDVLYREFHNFKNGKPFSNSVVQKLLHLYKPKHLTNVAQLTRLGLEKHDPAVTSQLASSGFNTQTLEELAQQHTLYKIVLSDVTNAEHAGTFALDSKLKNNYTFTCKQSDDRSEALKYIKLLLSNCSSIFIYDIYFENNWDTNKQFFMELMPRKQVNIFHNGQLDNIASDICRIHHEWSLKLDRNNQSYNNSHDRYLIINNKDNKVLMLR